MKKLTLKLTIIIFIIFGTACQVQAQEKPDTTATEETATKNQTEENTISNEEIKPIGIRAVDVYNTCRKYFDHTFNTRQMAVFKASCSSYFFGVGSTILSLPDSQYKSRICMPEDISTDQIIESFLRWLKVNQDKTEMFITKAALKALRQTYPCAGKASKTEN